MDFLLQLALALGLPAPIAEDGYAARFEREVDKRVNVPVEERAFYADLLEYTAGLALSGDAAQFILLVDRCPNVQTAALFWRSASGEYVWIGASPVSTGKPGQREYFETPVGVFAHAPDNRDYRAMGTRNEFGIRGYGRKGMRVFDLGWVKSAKGWGDRGPGFLRLQMHATDPDRLEPLLGRPLSKGCIRIPATLNRFIDHYGILDADYDSQLSAGRRFSVLEPDREPTAWAGHYVVVVDSRRAEKPYWAPGATVTTTAHEKTNASPRD